MTNLISFGYHPVANCHWQVCLSLAAVACSTIERGSTSSSHTPCKAAHRSKTCWTLNCFSSSSLSKERVSCRSRIDFLTEYWYDSFTPACGRRRRGSGRHESETAYARLRTAAGNATYQVLDAPRSGGQGLVNVAATVPLCDLPAVARVRSGMLVVFVVRLIPKSYHSPLYHAHIIIYMPQVYLQHTPPT